VTSKSQDDIQRVSEVRATVSRKGSFFLSFLVHVCCICWHTGWRKMEFICCVLVLFFGYIHTPRALVVENKDGKARCELPSYLSLRSVVSSLFLFSFFSFLFAQFIMQYIHCIQIRRGHVRRHYCTETAAAKTWAPAHIDILGFGLSAYRGRYCYN
jgi:hypothetical protein